MHPVLATDTGGTERQAKQSCGAVKKPSLPVNDNGVWGGFVSVATTFLVTASAAEQLQRAVLKQTSAFFCSVPAATMQALSSASREEAVRLPQAHTERLHFWQAPVHPIIT